MTIFFLSRSQLLQISPGRTETWKRLPFAFILLIIALSSAASAFYIQDPMVFKPSLSPGYITIGTGYYDGPNDVDWMVDANYLYLNETMKFNASANVTLSSITHASSNLTLTAYGGGGTLNFSANLTNASTKFFYKFDGAFSQTLTSNSTGWISGSQVVSGTHDLAFGLRNVTFSGASLSPASATVFSSFSVSVNINDNDAGTISSATAQVQKPSGTTQNYSMTHGAGNLWSLSFTDSGTTGAYSVLSFNATDSSGANFSTGSSLSFTIVQTPAGGGGGGGGGAGGSTLQNFTGNVTAGEPTPIQVSGPIRQGAQVGGLFWWLALTVGGIMSVMSLSDTKASRDLLFIGLAVVFFSAWQLQLFPPVTAQIFPNMPDGNKILSMVSPNP